MKLYATQTIMFHTTTKDLETLLTTFIHEVNNVVEQMTRVSSNIDFIVDSRLVFCHVSGVRASLAVRQPGFIFTIRAGHLGLPLLFV